MEHGGVMTPLSLEDYIRHNGFEGYRKALELSPEEIVSTISKAGLRGRGGAGFPTGRKWELAAKAKSEKKYIVCNGDEGDPGAFMDRMLLESFPYRIIEGVLIAAKAIGATEGIFYIRAEYPRAVSSMETALENIANSDIDLQGLRLRVVQGAGAFVCGEETALIASLEGRRGEPRLRPPYPVESGLFGYPTCIGNVETFANVPWIMRNGSAAFSSIGTPHSKGTKVFSLAGKVNRGGLIEVPMGVTIRQIVEQIGGGVPEGRAFKAVQIGGPSGGCIPASLSDTPIDFEALHGIGAIMGSGGLVVLDDTDCMIDIARYFLQFTQKETCGQCSACRIGTKRMLDIVERICEGRGHSGDIEKLEDLAEHVKSNSICGLGQTAPNPVLTTLRYFRGEYDAHIQGKCPAKVCRSLIRYDINNKCIGCALCSRACPVKAIDMTPYARHAIKQELCIKCDACRRTCPEGAVDLR
jgi:NADH-quinone oxidoreductase subunit F